MPNHLRKCKKAKRMMKQNKRNKATNSFHMHKQTLVDNSKMKLNKKYENYTQLAKRAKDESASLTKIFHTSKEEEEEHLKQRNSKIITSSSSSNGTMMSRIPCAICGRKFSADRIGKHQKICRKNNASKRRVFDATKQRIEGTEMATHYNHQHNNRRRRKIKKGLGGRKANRPSNNNNNTKKQYGSLPSSPRKLKLKAMNNNNIKKTNNKKSSNWKEQSNMLRQAIQQSKLVSNAIKNGTDLSLLPPPIPTKEPEQWVKCPTCHRTFNPQSGARHISKCKSILNKPKTLLKGSGGGAGMYNGRTPNIISPESTRRLKRISPIKEFGQSNGNIINRNRKHTTFGAGRDIEQVRPTIYGNGGNNNGMFHRENIRRPAHYHQKQQQQQQSSSSSSSSTRHRHRRRIQSKAPSFNGGPNTFGSPSSSSSRFGRGSGSSGRGGMNNASGGVITSNATSRNNPMLTNHLQASPHPFGTNASKYVSRG